jgi:hypothetical protein
MASVVAAGMVFGSLRIVQKVADDSKTRSPNLKKRWRVECVCKKRLTLPEYYLLRKPNPKTHCGCLIKTIKTHFNREYRIWHMMHVRCYDPRHEAFKHYGGRGIGVCAAWHKDAPDGKGFERFLQYIGPSPGMEFSIDRVDNNLGYQPFQADGVTRQVRWATAKEQRANQRVK